MRSAAINATSLALMDASIELKDSIVSCSSGLLLSGPISSVIGKFFLIRHEPRRGEELQRKLHPCLFTKQTKSQLPRLEELKDANGALRRPDGSSRGGLSPNS